MAIVPPSTSTGGRARCGTFEDFERADNGAVRRRRRHLRTQTASDAAMPAAALLPSGALVVVLQEQPPSSPPSSALLPPIEDVPVAAPEPWCELTVEELAPPPPSAPTPAPAAPELVEPPP